MTTHNTALFLAFVLLAGYASGNTIRENENVIAEEILIPLEVENTENSNAELMDNNPAIIVLQGVGPSRQCAGVGQACSSHGDCCTNSCFGLLRSCVPNLGFSLNLQIGAPTGSK